MKKLKGIFFFIFCVINLIILIKSPDTKARNETKYGEWCTLKGPKPGELVDWQCYESKTIECTVGETGKGFFPG